MLQVVSASAKGDCSDVQKEKYDIMFCKSGTCTTCCDAWCKSTCENLESSMKEDGCECEEKPEAFSKEDYCKDKADAFEAKMARACTLGCDTCCKKGLFLQADG